MRLSGKVIRTDDKGNDKTTLPYMWAETGVHRVMNVYIKAHRFFTFWPGI